MYKRALSIAILVSMSGCADYQPLIPAPDDAAPDQVVGMVRNGNEVLLDFEGIRSLDLGAQWYRFGVIELHGYWPTYDMPYAWSTFGFDREFPPTSGRSAIWYAYGWTVLNNEWRFPEPASNLKFNIRAWANFDITCYNAAGAVVGSVIVPGMFDQNFVYQGPLVLPGEEYPLQQVVVPGSGIRRCAIALRGAMIDDVEFRIGQPDLVLECKDSAGRPNVVLRGEEMTCRAKAGVDPSNLQVTSWKFRSSDGLEIVPDDPAQNSDTTWAGPMVRSGTVIVTATVSGQSQTDSVSVTVLDRDWSNRAPAFSFRKIRNGEDDRLVLPSVIRWAEDLGAANVFQSETSSERAPDFFMAEVPRGPNLGLDYFGDETNLYFYGYYVLNDSAMTRGSAFYNAQERNNSSGGTTIGGFNWCDASVITTTLPGLVDAHERYHGEAYLRVLTRELPSALSKLERVTSEDIADLDQAYDDEWDSLDELAMTASRAIHKERGNPGRVTPRDSRGDCALKNQSGQLLQTEPEPGN